MLQDAKDAEDPDNDMGTQLWDIHALHMRLIRRQIYRGRLEVLYDRVTNLQGEDSSPERTAFVKECSAYVHFRKGNYPRAYRDFFEAFASYPPSPEKARYLAYAILLGVLAKTPSVPSTAAAALEDDRLVHDALKLVDAYRTGGYRQMEEGFEECDEMLRNDEFAKQILGAIRLPLVTARMPSDIWKDVFQPLSRRYLEPTGIACRSWRGLADGPTAPARHFDHVAFLPPRAELIHAHFARPPELRRGRFFAIVEPYTDSPLTFEWSTDAAGAGPNIAMIFAMKRLFDSDNQAPEQVNRSESRVMLRLHGVTRHDRRALSREGPLAELVEFMIAATRHAFVEHFYLAGPTTEQFAHSLSPQFINEITIKTLVYGVPEGQASAEDAATFHRFFLSFRHTPKLVVTSQVHAAFMTDAFLAECVARGVTDIRLPRLKPRGEDGNVSLYPVSTEAVFDFCFSAGNRGEARSFNVWRFYISANFIERIVNDSENPGTTDPVELRFFVPRDSPVDRALHTSLRTHSIHLVRCARNLHRREDTEIYRWTTTPQILIIKSSLREETDRKRFYRIRRGLCDESREFKLCDCTPDTEAFFNR